MYFSQLWSLENPKSRCWQILCLVRACFLVRRCCLLTVLPSHGGKVWGALWDQFYKGTNFILEGVTLIS